MGATQQPIRTMTFENQQAILQQVAECVTENKPDAPRFEVYADMCSSGVLYFSGTHIRCRLHPAHNEQGYAFCIFAKVGFSEVFIFSGINTPEQTARALAPIVAQQLQDAPGIIYEN